ncbi:hypothetical protein WJX73_009349 [Symbiochloris irregularis]|uniref:Flavin-containing monooxygenase n=1 Tax=Symbiochloris irregularis TaxID=706552 RepID=A0AAW1PIN0_9CHLO
MGAGGRSAGGEPDRSVAIIGAGVSGLVLARALQRSDIPYVVFEKDDRPGGVWRSTTHRQGAQVAYEYYELPEFNWPADLKRKSTAALPPGDLVQEYLEEYAAHFNLLPSLRFATEVSNIQQIPGPSRLQVQFKQSGQEHTQVFSEVAVCTGFCITPRELDVTGRDQFMGKIIHASELTSSKLDLARNKHVVVYGGGKSSLDASVAAAEVSEHTTHLFRTAHWPVKRAIWRLMEIILPIQQRLPKASIPSAPIAQDLFSLGILENDAYIPATRAGKIEPVHGEISALVPNGVQLQNGTQVKADLLIQALGWDKPHQYLSPALYKALDFGADGVHLYRNVVSPAAQGLYFIGGESVSYNHPLLVAVQSEWLARLLKGDVQLPDQTTMAASIAENRRWRQFMPQTNQRAGKTFMYQLPYFDELLRDMGENPYRKGWGLLRELWEPYTASPAGCHRGARTLEGTSIFSADPVTPVMATIDSLPDDILLRVFRHFAWCEDSSADSTDTRTVLVSDRVQLPNDGPNVRALSALCFTCKRFRQIITEGSPLWTRVELTGVETCWKDAQLQSSFLSWIKPKQSSIKELLFATTPRSILQSDQGLITSALLTSLAPQLRTAGIHAVIPTASITALAQCRELTELHLNCESDFELAPLANLSKLVRIVTFLPGVNPEDFPQCGASLMPWLACLPRLQDLTLQGVPRDWAVYASSLTSLKTLSLLGYNVNGSAPRQLYSGLTRLPSLTSIQVEGSQFHPVGDADSVMAAAAKLSTLQRLVIRNCTVLSSETWCPSLRRLSASLTRLELHELWGLSGPSQLSKLANLRCLAFSKPQVTGSVGLPPMLYTSTWQSWNSLQELSLQNCDLASWPKGLWGLSLLRRLDLSRNRASNLAQLVGAAVVCSMIGGHLAGVQHRRPANVASSQPPQLTARPVVVHGCRHQIVRAVTCRASPILDPATGGRGGGSFRGDGNNGRFGGGHGPWWRSEGDDEEDGQGSDRDVSTNASSGASLRWKGWQERVDADPSFRDKVLIEQIIGVAASVIGDMSSRPHWGLHELDFVFSTLVVGSILNFSLMYFLAPTTGGAAAGGLLQRLFSDLYLRRWGAPGGHLFEPGFAVSKRLLNFGYKGMVFGTIGLGAGVVGTSMSNSLLKLRKKMDPGFESPNKPPDVALNAATWALHMGVSSNLRYQILNGLDMVLSKQLGPTGFRVVTSIMRTANNAVGGISFVTLARLTGVQAAGSSEVDALEAAEAP